MLLIISHRKINTQKKEYIHTIATSNSEEVKAKSNLTPEKLRIQMIQDDEDDEFNQQLLRRMEVKRKFNQGINELKVI